MEFSETELSPTSRNDWEDRFLRAAFWKRRSFFKIWNSMQSSEDWAYASIERKWTRIFEELGSMPPVRLPREIQFISRLHSSYPEALLELSQPPLGLFVRGIWKSGLPRIGVIGSRKPTPYARRVARDFSIKWSRAGFVIVSGGAIGIDGEAHQAAVESGGITLVVLGSGHNNIYPRYHENLFRDVLQSGGCIVSEYPPDTAPQNYYFPERNRIIAALSDLLFLAQAHEKSGSLSTARTALDLGKDIYVLRPVAGDENFAGSQALIDAGAKSLLDPLDLDLSHLRMEFDPPNNVLPTAPL